MELALNFRGFSGLLIKRPKNFLGDFFAHLHYHFIPHHSNNYHPHIFSARMTSLFAALLLSVKVFSLAFLSLSPADSALSSAITSPNIISLTNQSRSEFGISELKENSLLSLAAQKKADSMAAEGYFSHNSPDGRQPWDFIKEQNYRYLMAGENLAVNFTEAENVEEAWMNSPGHKANILNKNFKEIGIGIAQGQYLGKTTTFVVQMFGLPAEEPIVLADKPTVVQTSEIPMPALPLTQKIIQPQKVAGESAYFSKEAKSLGGSEIKITEAKIVNNNTNLAVSASLSGAVVKVYLMFNDKAAMLSPKGDGLWEANLPASALGSQPEELVLRAFDIQGASVSKEVAGYSPSAILSYGPKESQNAGTSLVFGKSLDLNSFQHNFYLLFAAAILTCLILAIAIKRHVQHIAVVANGSFVAILAMLLWLG